AAVAEDDPPTTAPLAREYEQQIQADLFVVTSKSGRLHASVGTIKPQPAMLDDMLRSHISDHETTWFWLHSGAVLKMAAIPLLLPGPDWVGTLVVGFRLDEMAQRIKDLTRSDIVIVAGSEIATSTLDSAQTSGLTTMAHERGVFNVRLAGEDYIGRVQPLRAGGAPVPPVLRARTAQTLFLRNLHRDL